MKQSLLIALAAAAAAALGIFAYLQLQPKAAEHALVYEPPRALAPFRLEHTRSDTRIHNDALSGQWTLLFTGYTFCPDICPTTMAQLREALPELQAVTDTPVRVWMISVDPKRDDLARLTQYANYFGEGFSGVRADHVDLFPFVRDLGLMYSIPGEDEQDYLVNHSAAIVLVNPNGQRHAIFNASHQLGEIPTVNMQHILTDFPRLVARYQP